MCNDKNDKVIIKKAGKFKVETKDLLERIIILFKWIIVSLLTGIVVGLVGVFVVKSITYVTDFREKNPMIILFLPLAGLFIVGLYHVTGRQNDSGTNAVLEAIKNKQTIHLRTTPLIIISTTITHMFGGSVGREGAALQFGGSLGESLGKVFRFNEKDRTIIIMAGMSAAFSAVFGLPISAVVFPMEVVTVGIMYYSALVPCTVASIVANKVTLAFGLETEVFKIAPIGKLDSKVYLSVVFLGIFCAIVSIMFCFALNFANKMFMKYFKSDYFRVLCGGSLVVVMSIIFGTDYNGLGTKIISIAVENGTCQSYDFLLKIFFTAITLAAGFKGGEIVPTFFIGATSGCFFGMLTGFNPGFCAAVGMVSVFCGVTNCPLASFLIACELFGFSNLPAFLLAIGITYVVSGYFSLYKMQKIMYSKTEPTFINRKAN